MTIENFWYHSFACTSQKFTCEEGMPFVIAAICSVISGAQVLCAQCFTESVYYLCPVKRELLPLVYLGGTQGFHPLTQGHLEV